MSLLLESIRIENRELQRIDLHNARFNKSRKALFECRDQLDLRELISLPPQLKKERYKLRLTSDGTKVDYTITPYKQREIKTLKLVESDDILYEYKTTERQMLDQAFAQRGDCDDIIVVKNGCLTDAWAANIILFDGSEWHTPDTPLLKGIQREYLLQKSIVKTSRITADNLHHYKTIKLINAMIDFNRANSIDISTGIRY